MFKAFEFCIPTKSTSVPVGPDWLHEIKYDGFRLRVERNGDRVQLITRGSYDWPTALKSKATSRSLLPVRGHLDPLGDVDSDLVAQRAYR